MLDTHVLLWALTEPARLSGRVRDLAADRRTELFVSAATYSAIEQVNRLVSPLEQPDHPEHHYRYDPDKSVAYVATTLAWVGDPAAESYAREIIARLKPREGNGKWPRRVAAANLDLALTLLVTGRLDEASDAALRAISSGRVVPSNHWRAEEVVNAVEARRLPEARDLREAYEELRRSAGHGVTGGR